MSNSRNQKTKQHSWNFICIMLARCCLWPIASYYTYMSHKKPNLRNSNMLPFTRLDDQHRWRIISSMWSCEQCSGTAQQPTGSRMFFSGLFLRCKNERGGRLVGKVVFGTRSTSGKCAVHQEREHSDAIPRCAPPLSYIFLIYGLSILKGFNLPW